MPSRPTLGIRVALAVAVAVAVTVTATASSVGVASARRMEQDPDAAPVTTVAVEAPDVSTTTVENTVETGVDRAATETDPDGATQPASAPPDGDSDGAPIWPWGLGAFGGAAVLAALSLRRRVG